MNLLLLFSKYHVGIPKYCVLKCLLCSSVCISLQSNTATTFNTKTRDYSRNTYYLDEIGYILGFGNSEVVFEPDRYPRMGGTIDWERI